MHGFIAAEEAAGSAICDTHTTDAAPTDPSNRRSYTLLSGWRRRPLAANWLSTQSARFATTTPNRHR